MIKKKTVNWIYLKSTIFRKNRRIVFGKSPRIFSKRRYIYNMEFNIFIWAMSKVSNDKKIKSILHKIFVVVMIKNKPCIMGYVLYSASTRKRLHKRTDRITYIIYYVGHAIDQSPVRSVSALFNKIKYDICPVTHVISPYCILHILCCTILHDCVRFPQTRYI